MKTVYFNEDFEPTDIEISYWEKALGVEVSLGDGRWINIYTNDNKIIQDFRDIVGDYNIQEISG